MVDLIIRGMFDALGKAFEPYFSLYTFYLPSVNSALNIFERDRFIKDKISKLNVNTKTNVLLGYSRTTYFNSELRFGGGRPLVNVARKIDDPLSAVLTDVQRCQFTVNSTILSQDVLNLEFIENFLYIKHSKQLKYEVKFQLEDAYDDFVLPYTIDISAGGDIGLLEEGDGKFWTFDLSFNVQGLVLSYESKLYPKIKEIYSNVYGGDSDKTPSDVRYKTTNYYSDDGFLTSWGVIKEKGDSNDSSSS